MLHLPVCPQRRPWYNSRKAAIIPGSQVLFPAPDGAAEKADAGYRSGCAAMVSCCPQIRTCAGRSHHAVYRLSPVLLQGLRGHGPPGAGAGGEHLSVLHPQSPGQQGQGPGRGGRRSPPGPAGGARLRPHRGTRSLHPEPLRRGGEEPPLRPGDHGGRPPAAGAPAGAALQLPPRQPCGPGHRSRHRPDRPGAQRHPPAGAVRHRAAGDHGRQGQRGGRPVRGAAGHPGPGDPLRQDGRLPGHLPRLRRRI